MNKEIKKLDKILKNQKKQLSKLKNINKTVNGHLDNQVKANEEVYVNKLDENDFLEKYVVDFIDRYLLDNSSEKIRMNFSKRKGGDDDNNFILFEYNYNQGLIPNVGAKQPSQKVDIEYLIIRLYKETCDVESNVYSESFKTDIYKKYDTELSTIYEQKEKEKIDLIFNEVIDISNLNRGNSFTLLDDILSED